MEGARDIAMHLADLLAKLRPRGLMSLNLQEYRAILVSHAHGGFVHTATIRPLQRLVDPAAGQVPEEILADACLPAVQSRPTTNSKPGKLSTRTRRSDEFGVTAHSLGGTLWTAFLRRGIEQF